MSGMQNNLPSVDELILPYEHLSPEQRDELLQCLLIAAPRGERGDDQGAGGIAALPCDRRPVRQLGSSVGKWRQLGRGYTLLKAKVILKYAVLQLAQIAVVVGVLILVRHFISIPVWLIITIPAVWILKDIALFPKVWRAYAFDDNGPIRQLVGLEATVVLSLNPVGYVRVRGELWKAELRNANHAAERGERTRVVDTRGTTLIVERREDQ